MDKASEPAALINAPARRRNPPHYRVLACAILALGVLAGTATAGHREHEERDIWFVHATDPHLFLKAAKDDKKKEAEKERQQGLNKKALEDMLKHIGSLPSGNGPAAFLLLTGDLGIDPCEICEAPKPTATVPPPAQSPSPRVQGEATPKPNDKKPSVQDCLKVVDKWRTLQVDTVADILGQSPVSDIYLVAGNNDIANESAGDEALQYFNRFIDDVQKQLANAKSRVVVHNLTRCYASGEAASTCYADIEGSDYRLIGFPSYSFKGEKDEAGVDNNQAQARQFETFRQLLEQARDAERKVLVVTHTPQMDDPYALGQSRYLNPTPSPTEASATRATPSASPTAAIATPSPVETANPGETLTPAATATPTPKKASTQTPTDKASSVATWKVSQKLLDDWKDLTARDSVAGVLAGHFHDSHKEIYRRPYVWSSGSLAAFERLFLAPPLAVKNQDSSPFQARGFSLVHLQPDRIESRLFWYDSETGSFTPDSKHKPRHERCGFWRKCCQDCRAAIKWLWNLDSGKPLERMAVLLIALLTAFLTLIAIWQIPAPADPFPEVKKPAPDDGKPAPAPANASGDSSPFSSRFGKTVIAGLAGLIAAEVTKTLANEKPSADSRWYYIVWFIVFFFFLLISLNLWRALVEALRSRFAIVYYPLPRPPETEPDMSAGRFGRWLVYRFWAFLHWLKSWLGVPLLTFADTFISLIQGKNQTTTRVFADKIVDQQRNVLRVAKEIREQLNTTILDYLTRQTGQKRDAKDVRVNISVLSADQTNVFYISKTRDSSRLSFPKRSMAWLAVFTGKIRWYTQSYKAVSKDIILFDNSAGTISDEVAKIPLSSYYQPRGGEDYEAFVVFPVPLSQRGSTSDYVKGAIHVSFSRAADFAKVWSFLSSAEATKQVDAKIAATTNTVEQAKLQASRTADIEALIRDTDPVITTTSYQSERKMLDDWCIDPGVCATLNTSLRVLGEVLRGFNEQIYKSIAKSEQD
jgi:hypothetical protein